MKLAIGCDEAAYQLKKTIMEHLSDIGVEYEDYGAAEGETVLDRKSTRLNSSHSRASRMPSSA